VGFTITAAEMMAFLASKGYHKETGRGKHGVKMAKDGNRIPIPAHPGDMRRKTVSNILSRAGFDENDVMEWRGQR
jgi:predicted RNA binding protein YcfA (HicA-like mRNA interferase family)